MNRYLNVREELFSEEFGKYTSYGICILKKEGDKWLEEEFISDVSLDETVVQSICKIASSRQFNTEKLYDVIDLFI